MSSQAVLVWLHMLDSAQCKRDQALHLCFLSVWVSSALVWWVCQAQMQSNVSVLFSQGIMQLAVLQSHCDSGLGQAYWQCVDPLQLRLSSCALWEHCSAAHHVIQYGTLSLSLQIIFLGVHYCIIGNSLQVIGNPPRMQPVFMNADVTLTVSFSPFQYVCHASMS